MTTAIAINVRMFCALAFVPQDEVRTGFDVLVNSLYYLANIDKLKILINYFENTWVGLIGRHNRRRGPIFSVELWNHYESILGPVRTNNAIEDLASRF